MFNKQENIYYAIVGTVGLLVLGYTTLFTQEYNNFNMVLLFVLSIGCIILENINVTIGEFTLTLDTSIMLAAYFILGLVPALWMITVILIISDRIINLRPKRKVYSNTGMFILMFAIVHYLFKILGIASIEANTLSSIWLAVMFGVALFLFNWGFLFLQFIITFKGELPEGFRESIVWDFYGNLIIIPLSILLCQTFYRYSYLGVVLFLGFIIFFNLLFRLIRNLVYMNRELNVVQEVAASISSRLDIKETTSNILKGIRELIEPDFVAILEIDKTTHTMKTLEYVCKDNIIIDTNFIDQCVTDNIEALIEYKKSFIIEDVRRSKLIQEMLQDLDQVPEDIGSMIYEPLRLENEIMGCVLIFSKTRNKFVKEQLQILDTLANQAVIAMENARLYKEAHIKAIKDGLTGLYNQRYFYDILDSITNKCSNCGNEPCVGCNRISLIIFDIDHFKLINDTFGHQTGDKILKDVSYIIQDNVRKNDIVARYGGEEFTVILPNADQNNAYEIADRIREAIENTAFYSVTGEIISLTISGGVSEYPFNADSSSSLLAYADRAMYSGAKKQGRNKISVYVN